MKYSISALKHLVNGKKDNINVTLSKIASELRYNNKEMAILLYGDAEKSCSIYAYLNNKCVPRSETIETMRKNAKKVYEYLNAFNEKTNEEKVSSDLDLFLGLFLSQIQTRNVIEHLKRKKIEVDSFAELTALGIKPEEMFSGYATGLNHYKKILKKVKRFLPKKQIQNRAKPVREVQQGESMHDRVIKAVKKLPIEVLLAERFGYDSEKIKQFKDDASSYSMSLEKFAIYKLSL